MPPPLIAEKPSRRTLLKVAGIGGLVLAGGAWVWNAFGRFGPPAPGNLIFDADEFVTVRALCEALFPGPPDWPLSADDAGTPKFFDTYVWNLYPDHHTLFRSLIRGIEVSTLLTDGGRFSKLPLDQRQAAFHAWGVSDLRLRRAGYQSLTFALKLGYYEDDRVRAAGGFTAGCNVPQDGRPAGYGGRTL
jgi:hypothetical protein